MNAIGFGETVTPASPERREIPSQLRPGVLDRHRPTVRSLQNHRKREAAVLRARIEREIGCRLDSTERTAGVCFLRHLGWYLLRRLTGASYPEIGQWCGGWEHTSVLYGIGRVQAKMRTHANLWIEIEALCERLQQQVDE
jgi:hypothetical protein